MRFSGGRGARCRDTDGREYIDLVCGYGPVVLGHGHPAVTQAVGEALAGGTLLPGPGPALDELGERLTALYPHHERLLTFKTGSEAVAAAIRIARVETGRDRVIRVGFHGWHDAVVSPYLSCHVYEPEAFTSELPPGVPHAAIQSHTSAWYGSDTDELVALIRASPGDLAAVVVDPVQLAQPFAERAGAVAAAVRDAGALLVFDESKTGLRVHLGGVQALHGVRADLTVLSKALANGMPLAVTLGSADLIGHAKASRIKGTYGGETASIAAALVTVAVLAAEEAPELLHERGLRLISGFNDVFVRAGLGGEMTAVAYRWPCMPYVVFRSSSARAQALQDPFYTGLRDEGVLMLRDHMSYVSLALGDADVDQVVAATGRVVERLGEGP
jgi:glutamate-1-semialdehyde 2,1-aminomutase